MSLYAPAGFSAACFRWARTLSVACVFFACAAGACSDAAAGKAPPQTGPIVVSLSVDAATAYVGQTVLLSWSSSNATACVALDGWTGPLPLSGTRRVRVSAAGPLRLALTCSNADQQASRSVATTGFAPAHALSQAYTPRGTTISSSEGAPYGDNDFWPEVDTTTSNFGYGPTRVQRIYICLAGMVPAELCSQQATPTGPLSDEMLAGIDKRFARLAGSGKRLLVRFVYNLGPIGPGARDASALVIAQHIDQLAPILSKHADVIFALQAGFVGTWGEWHSSTAGNTARPIRKLIIERLLLQMGGRFPILLRYPGQLMEFLADSQPGQPLRPHPQLGLHDDYYASDSTDGGTWAGYNNPSVSSSTLLQQFAAEVSTTTMFMGEFGETDSRRQACKNLDAYSQRFHPQSIALGVWPPEVGTELHKRGCALSFFNKVGTRIELLSAQVLASADGARPMRVELSLENAGYGRVLRARPVTLVWSDGNADVARIPIALESLDLRQLKSGAGPMTFGLDLPVPADLQSALNRRPLTVSLWMPDPGTSLAAAPAHALPLNSVDPSGQDVFVARTGLNRIGTLQRR